MRSSARTRSSRVYVMRSPSGTSSAALPLVGLRDRFRRRTRLWSSSLRTSAHSPPLYLDLRWGVVWCSKSSSRAALSMLASKRYGEGIDISKMSTRSPTV